MIVRCCLKGKLHSEIHLLELFFWDSRSSPPEVFLGKGVLKICSKFTGEHPCRSEMSIKWFCNFIEITLQHMCSPVNLLHIFRTLFLRNTSRGLRLRFADTAWKVSKYRGFSGPYFPLFGHFSRSVKFHFFASVSSLATVSIGVNLCKTHCFRS